MSDQLAQKFQKFLSQHGDGFQCRVLERVIEVCHAAGLSWRAEVAEFPVEAGGNGTRIDFILSGETSRTRFAGFKEPCFWMAAECKRVNPSLHDWCFARLPFIRQNHREKYVVDLVKHDTSGASVVPMSVRFFEREPYFHKGYEIKGDKPGEAIGRSAIEEHVGQVVRGTNGLINFLRDNPSLIAGGKYLLPVVFTTATLWSAGVDLNTTDLETGNVPEFKTLERCPFVFLQYPVSPGLKHGGTVTASRNLSEHFEANAIRTVAIVSSTNIEDFFKYSDPDRFDPAALTL